jgi:hypothetical protein
LTISLPILRNVFSFDFPGYKHFIISFLGAMGVLVVLEFIKLVKHFKTTIWGKSICMERQLKNSKKTMHSKYLLQKKVEEV